MCPESVASSSPDTASQSFAVRSALAVANRLPSGENAICSTELPCPSTGVATPVDVFQSVTAPSRVPTPTVRPSTANATAVGCPASTANVETALPVDRSQSLSVRSEPAVTARAPSGETASETTGPPGTSIRASSRSATESHTRSVPSRPPETTRDPPAEDATAVTASV